MILEFKFEVGVDAIKLWFAWHPLPAVLGLRLLSIQTLCTFWPAFLFLKLVTCLPSHAAATVARAFAKLLRWLLFRWKPRVCTFLPDGASPNQAESSFCPQNGWNVTLCGMGLIFWAVTKGLDDTTQSSGESTACELKLDWWDMGNSREQGNFPSFIPCGVR